MNEVIIILYCPKHGEYHDMVLEVDDGMEYATCDCGVVMVREPWKFLKDKEV